MAEYYTILTDAGRALEAASLAGQTTYKLKFCALGDGHAMPDPTRTTLQSEVWRGPINTITPDVNNLTWLILETHVPPEIGGFTIREFGIYTDTGILFAVGNYPETYKPTLAEGTGVDLIVRPICEVSNATSVTLLTDPSVMMASKRYIDDRLAFFEASFRALFALRSELGRPVLAGEPVWLAGPYLPPNHVWPDRSLILFDDWPEMHQRYQDGLLGVATTPTDKANFPGAFAISDDGKGLYLPNLGGYFLRAWRPSQTVDAGRKSGSAQGDAIRNITGTIWTAHNWPFSGANGAFSAATAGTITGTPLNVGGTLYASLNFDASRQVPVAGENRPLNMSMPVAIYLGKPKQET